MAGRLDIRPPHHGRRTAMSRSKVGLALIVLAVALAHAPAFVVAAGSPSPPADVRINQDHSGNPQVETSMAADPGDPRNLVAVWCEVTRDSTTTSAVGLPLGGQGRDLLADR